MRSLLFVPGDDERKIAKGLASAADALILDLEDSVGQSRKDAARALCAATLANGARMKLFVRINALDTPAALLDLAAVVKARPYGIMLPKCRSGDDARLVAHYLTALEARDGVPAGETKLLPIVTETGGSMFGLGSYDHPPIPRLCGMLWGGEDLAADLGGITNRDEDGRYGAPYLLARSLCLFAAAAAAVVAVDAVYTNFRDPAGLRKEAIEGLRSGFSAKAAIHPDQIAVINEAFTPSAADVEAARQVIAAFDASPGAGVVSVGGKMLDRPHYRTAQRVLARAAGA
jgi:citrate lyase subunit beta / citryl-CoA lyase